MKVRELKDKFSLKVLAGEDGLDNEISGFYACDLLSWVLGKAHEGNALLTVMGNVNSIGVATMLDLSCIILTEDAWLDEDAKLKANTHNIPVLSSTFGTFELSRRISKFINI